MEGFPIERRREITGVLLLGITFLLFFALLTDGYQGDVRRPLKGMAEIPNGLGPPGAIAAGCLMVLFGHAAHLLYCITAIWGVMQIRHQPLDRLPTRFLGLVIMVTGMAGLLHIDSGAPSLHPGGIAGTFAGGLLYPYFGLLGANIIVLTILFIGVLLATEFLIIRCFSTARDFGVYVTRGIVELYGYAGAYLEEREAARAARLAYEGAPGAAVREATGSARERRRAAKASGETGSGAASQSPAHKGAKAGGQADETAAAAKPGHHEGALPEAPSPRDLNDIRINPTPKADEPDAGDKTAGHAQQPPRAGMEESAARYPNSASATASQAARDEAYEDTSKPAIESSGTPDRGLEPEAPDSARPARKPKAPSLYRRIMESEPDLPADFEYPKVFTRPSLDLLENPPELNLGDLSDHLRQMSGRLEETLTTFGIEARVTEVTRGPTITRFELEPAPGIKVNRFIALADDLALALKAHRVRVEAPIPGKGRVGIEVPNKNREPVVLRELLESRSFKQNKAHLGVVLGKDIAGEVIVADLATMPHLLVAGATGSGKTVCVKTLLASLLFAKTPEEMQLMLIDPKMVELSIFNEIPHLITPVVTDPKKAATSLTWLINEMEERYRLFAHLRVRNIEVYNESVANGEIEMKGEETGEADSVDAIRKLPYIVCIIDELADLMMLARSEVENAIARLAQLARAVGIHLIIATQRPSVDVLTGVIKANFPARVSFQVSSRVDSRCILDSIGAERLIGRGDMLYLPAGHSKPTRIQGAFVSDEEMNRLVAYLKRQAPPQYRDEIAHFGADKEKLEILEDEDDELFNEAVRVVLDTGQASISMVQRKLRVGYTRAARLIDMMEIRGIVGPHVGSKPREILVEGPPGENDEVA